MEGSSKPDVGKLEQPPTQLHTKKTPESPKLSSKAAVDNIHSLSYGNNFGSFYIPVEIMNSIFKYLTLREKCKLLRVSKFISNFVRASKHMWNEIDIRHHKLNDQHLQCKEWIAHSLYILIHISKLQPF